MAVEKIIPKDKETQEKKYLLFLEFVLNKLKNGRKSGISLRNIANDYKLEMGTVINRKEQHEFIELYNGKYFEKVSESIDRLKIKPETNKFIFKNASIKGFIVAKENQSSLKNDFRNNTKTQKSEIKKQLTKTTPTISGVITALIITVVGGVIILIVWELWGTQIMNFLKPLP